MRPMSKIGILIISILEAPLRVRIGPDLMTTSPYPPSRVQIIYEADRDESQGGQLLLQQVGTWVKMHEDAPRLRQSDP